MPRSEGSTQELFHVAESLKFLHHSRSHLWTTVGSHDVRYSPGPHDASDERDKEFTSRKIPEGFYFAHPQASTVIANRVRVALSAARKRTLAIDDNVPPRDLELSIDRT